MALPSALKRDTIIECVTEMRFGATDESADSLIPGIVFTSLKGRFSKSTQLPTAQLPKVLRDSQPNLMYAATSALEGDGFKLLLSGRSAIVSFTRPYPGWSKVRPTILECFQAVLRTSLVKSVERISIKYINVVGNADNQHELGQLNVKLQMDGFDLRGPGTHLRAETDHNNCTTIIEIQSGVTVTINRPSGPETSTGVGLYIDAIKFGRIEDPENQIEKALDEVHTTVKQVYFGLLHQSTLAELGPHY